MAVVEVEGLCKRYRSWRGTTTVAVDQLDLEVPEGGVFGLLGPNGSGKTTTLRCLLGLARPTGGSCRLLGSDTADPRGLAAALRRVGAVVEAPALFPTFSARRNLTLLGGVYGLGAHQVDQVLERVGLAAWADRLVRSYSFGMLQRLGIAAALLKDPAVLVLDEPTNGLDPAGIKQVRELIGQSAGEGRTVLVASHLLAELEQVCDRVAILAGGRLLASGTLAELLAGRGGLQVTLDDPAAGLAALRAAGIPAVRDGDRLRASPAPGPAQAQAAVKALADQGLYPSELRAEQASLDTVFLQLTSHATSTTEAL